MHRFFALFLAFMILAGSVAFAEGLNIVCTSFPCYDFARAVIGNEENIRLLIKPGAEVHAYEPAPSDILALADCDLFIYIGGESDAWVEDILDSFGADAPETLRLFDCVDAVEAEHEDDHHDMQYDEHIWTSPVNAQRMIAAIAEKLAAIDSARSQLYADNAELYIQQVSEIDSEIRSIVADSERKEFVFADRFPFIYLAEEYGLSYISVFPSFSRTAVTSASNSVRYV